MPGILSLPFELLVEVAKLVPEPILLTTVCRMLNDVATPVAYRSITFAPLSPWHYRPYPTLGAVVKVVGCLLRALIGRPFLGTNVRHLRFAPADSIIRHAVVTDYDEATKISEDVRILATEAAASHGVLESVRDQVAGGMLGASFFLLLCYCPNLSSLDIVPEFGADFFRNIVASRMLPCGLRSLRSVRIRQDDVNERLGHEDMFTLFSLPSLRIVICDVYYFIGDDDDDALTTRDATILFRGMSQVEDISVEACHVQSWILATMVRSVQGLRSFTYQIAGNSYRPFAGAVLGDALRNHAHTLQHLTIEVIDISYEDDASLGTLRVFTKLEHLCVSMPMLVSDFDPDMNIGRRNLCRIGDLLPASLISFSVCIDDAWKDTAGEYLVELIQLDLGHVPNLKRLSLGIRRDFPISDSYYAASVQAACIAAGIEFSLEVQGH